MLAFLWAEDAEGGIGKDGQLPWSLSDDMAFFKQTTVGNTIVAGTKTYASFHRPLPNRTNIVLTHQSDDQFPDGVIVCHTVPELLKVTEASETPVYVVGGADIFSQLMPYATDLLRTKIEATYGSDTFMSPINYEDFDLLASQTVAATESDPEHTFEHWRRR
ncbi:dihydrofolate reductase [Levilactobacillus bambusae]|uniref:dihydrofolate reductase n=1 Tax=Levilactobacillus bambusae TaxID=2024736 RepID=A0A2V1N0L6_9LACO|nr:dihydrofolate reductase [Levilactobacillus bambusae]PWG00811.1 dihydrofolate reductase [Levilactobacillus bambusae]